MGSLFTLGNMWILALFPLGMSAILFAYRKGGKSDLMPAPTLFILQMLQRESSASKRVRPPWRILLDFLALLFILLAAGKLFIGTSSERTLIVLDNSLSMAAGNESSFEKAREAAERKVASLGLLAQVSLLTPCPAPTRWTQGYVASREILSKLEEIKPEFCADRLEELLSSEISRSNATRVVVITDRSGPFAPVRNAQESEIAIEFLPTRSWDSQAYNFALEGLTPQEDKASVDVKRYLASPTAASPGEITLELAAGDDNGNWSIVSEQTLKFGDAASLHAEFKIPAEGKTFKLALGFGSSGKRDALSEDNTLFFVKGSSGNKIGLISPLSSRELGLNALPGFTVEDIKEGKKFEQEFRGSAIIYHRVWPDELPAKNAIFILPPAGSSLFTTEILKGPKKVTRWEVSHPITSYLTLSLLEVTDPAVIIPPAWLKSIIFTEKGALVAAGELEGIRYVYTGFELFPYRGKESPLLSILTLNTLKWLSASSGRSGFRLVGESLPYENLSSPPRYVFTLADNNSLKGGSAFTAVKTQGRFLLTLPGIVAKPSSDGTQEFVAVNFISSQESDLFDRPELSIPSIKRSDSLTEENGQALDWYLTMAALLFILIVWCLDLRTKRLLKPKMP